jgi:hypothetical protein
MSWDNYGTYGDEEAYATGMRTSYGAQAQMYAQAAFANAQTTVGGAAAGMHNMLSQAGSHIMPISYTPPAQVVMGYGGGYMQKTGMVNDLRTMTGFGVNPLGARPSQLMYNAGSDMGERLGLMGAGALSASASIGVGLATLPMGIFSGIGVSMAASQLADRVVAGVEQRREVSNYLGNTSYSYIGAGSSSADLRRGGFSLSARDEVADFIRKSSLRDMQMDFGEYQNVLKSGTEMGMFAGTSDVEDFKKKFKGLVTNVKVVSQALNQSIEEAMRTMKELKGIGLEGSAATSLVTGASVYGAASGRTGAEMLGIALQGAELFRGTGVTMSIGAAGNMMNLSSIRAARDAKLLSQEAIAQAGGEEALAQRMTGSSLQFMQYGTGRALAASYTANGEFNERAAMQSMYGGDSTVGAYQRAANMMNDPASYMKFSANQAKIQSQIGGMFGGRGAQFNMMNGIMMDAEFYQQAMGKNDDGTFKVSTEDAFRFTAKSNYKMSDSEVDAMLGTIKGAEESFKASAAATNAKRMQEQSDAIARNHGFTGAIRRIGKDIDSFVDPVSKGLNDSIVTPMQRFGADLADSYNGIVRADGSRLSDANSAATGSRMTVDEAKARVASASAGLGKMKTVSDQLEKITISMDEAKTQARPEDIDRAKNAMRSRGFSKSGGDTFRKMVEEIYGKKMEDLSSQEISAVRVAAQGFAGASDLVSEAESTAAELGETYNTMLVSREKEIIERTEKTERGLATTLGIDHKQLKDGSILNAIATGDAGKIHAALEAKNLGEEHRNILTADGKVRGDISEAMKGYSEDTSNVRAFRIVRGQMLMERAITSSATNMDAKTSEELSAYKSKYLTGDAAKITELLSDEKAVGFMNAHGLGNVVKMAEDVRKAAKDSPDTGKAQEVYNRLVETIGGKEVVAGSTSGSYGNTNDKQAMDQSLKSYQTLTNINVTTQQILSSLAERLKK